MGPGLYEALCPGLYVLRVFGLAPYRLARDGSLRVSGPSCLFALLWASIYSYVVVTALMRFEGLERNRPVLGVTENGKVPLRLSSPAPADASSTAFCIFNTLFHTHLQFVCFRERNEKVPVMRLA